MRSARMVTSRAKRPPRPATTNGSGGRAARRERRGSGATDFRPRGLTMVEAIISMLIIGVMLVAALNTVGAAKVTERKAADRSHGVLLAQDLLSEVLQQAYEDPDLAAGSFGLGADEVGDGSRALWEDVDDYDGWSASPPEARDGTVVSGFDDWERQVDIAWVDPDDLETVVGSDQGAKRVTVTVLYNDMQIAELVAVRTNKADAASPLRGGRSGLGPLDLNPLDTGPP